MATQTSADTIEFVEVEGAMGLEVQNVDLADKPSDEVVDLYKEKLAENGVLVFRNQQISEEQQIAFTRAFGETTGHPVPGVGGGSVADEYGKDIFYLVNDPEKENEVTKRDRGDGTLGWHTDLEYMPEPQVYSVLYGVEIPSKGGQTEWCDLTAAYEGLDEETKARVQSWQVVRWYSRRIPQVSHPAVRRHPITGKKNLYVSPSLCRYIEGMEQVESKEMILDIVRHATQPKFCYVHTWREGDVLVWDNRCTLHRRHGFDVQERRVVRRSQTVGEPVFV